MLRFLLYIAIGTLCITAAVITISIIQDIRSPEIPALVCHVFGLGINLFWIWSVKEVLKFKIG